MVDQVTSSGHYGSDEHQLDAAIADSQWWRMMVDQQLERIEIPA